MDHAIEVEGMMKIYLLVKIQYTFVNHLTIKTACLCFLKYIRRAKQVSLRSNECKSHCVISFEHYRD